MKKLITYLAIIAFIVSLWFTAFAACGTVTPKDYTCYYYHRNSLPEEFLEIYNKIEDTMLNNRKHAIIVTDFSAAEVLDVINAVYYDHPEVLNNDVEDSAFVSEFGSVKIVTLFYADDMLGVAYDEVDKIVAELEEYNSYDQIGLLYEKLTSSITYDKESENCENIYGAFITKRAKCVGIAKAFACVATKLGYENYMVYTNKLVNEGHIWNRVLIDGTWYEFDATFDNGLPRSKWAYFGVANAHPEATNTRPLS